LKNYSSMARWKYQPCHGSGEKYLSVSFFISDRLPRRLSFFDNYLQICREIWISSSLDPKKFEAESEKFFGSLFIDIHSICFIHIKKCTMHRFQSIGTWRGSLDHNIWERDPNFTWHLTNLSSSFSTKWDAFTFVWWILFFRPFDNEYKFKK
jgi:hypothetical protein